VDQALSFLTTRQREVIGLRFGVGKNSEALTQKEVGKELGLSQGRIQQIETAAFRNLQNPMRSTKIYQTFSGEILEQK
jgi:RNA polymerase nonessential primary-like sigma factor